MSSGGGTTVQTSDPWGPAQPYLMNVLSGANDLYGAQAPTMGMSPLTQSALGMTAQRAMGGSPLVQTAQNTVQNMAGGGALTNPHLDQMFGTAANKVSDYTKAMFTGAGRSPGSNAASQDVLQKNIGALASQMYGQAYDTGQNRQLEAARMAPHLASQDYLDLQSLLGVGQQYDQAPWGLLGNYGSLVTGTTSPFGVQSREAPRQSLVPQLLGGAMMAAPLLMSDRRMKRDIEKIGETSSGIPVYLFRYKDGREFHFGVMADEVEKIAPEAVVTGADGYKRVRYDLVS